MIDAKKLITVFLILSAISSSLAFVFSDSITGQALTPTAANITLPPDTPPAVPANAFVEPLPQNTVVPAPKIARSDDPLPPITPTSNLTEALSQSLAREFVKTNIGGPVQTDAGYQVSMPGETDVFNSLTLGLKIDKNKLIPKFGEKIPDSELKILANAGEKDKTDYIDSVNKILGQTIASDDFQNLSEQDPSDNVLFDARRIFDKAIGGLKTIIVPDSLTNLHKSLLISLIDQKKFFDSMADYQADPLKTALVLNDISKKIGDITKNDLENYARELNRNFSQTVSETKNKNIISAAANYIFGIKTAHAQGVFVPVNDFHGNVLKGLHLGETISEFVKGLVISILKQVIVKRMQAQIVQWVQGGGKPQFITNWKGFLGKTFNDAAGIAINDLAPGLCRSIGPLVQVYLRNAYFPPPQYGGCTLDQVVNNVKGFYNNFENGGWVAYAAATQPSGNFYDSLFFGSQIVSNEANKQQQASQNEGIASRGFLSIKECPSGSVRVGNTNQCQSLKFVPDPDAKPGEVPTLIAQKQYSNSIDVTPGGAVADMFFTGLKTPTDLIANATQWGDIMAVFVGSLVNALVHRGVGLLTTAL